MDPPPLSFLGLVPRGEGWILWLLVAGCVTVALLLANVLRRRLLRPMSHKPSDTTDAWAEAGRRFRVPDADQEEEPSEDEGSP